MIALFTFVGGACAAYYFRERSVNIANSSILIVNSDEKGGQNVKIKRQKLLTDLMSSKNLGFSIVELIGILLVSSILMVVLAPALLSYVEGSRAQKDNYIMNDVVDAVFLAMVAPSVYDEVLQHSMLENVSCYIDVDTENKNDRIISGSAIGTDIHDKYVLEDGSRLGDEVAFHAAGNVRGTTITFKPTMSFGKTKYVVSESVINSFFPKEDKNICNLPNLYNAIRSTIGDSIELKSQTYRNSEYTVFVEIRSVGAGHVDSQKIVRAYGQFSGTNLLYEDRVYYVAYGRDVCDPMAGVRPTHTRPQQPGNEYGETTLNPDDGTTPSLGDLYVYGNYEYCYGYAWCDKCSNWSMPIPIGCGCAAVDKGLGCDGWALRIIDETKDLHGPILQSINGEPVIRLEKK